jgi:hypothetical protein
MGAAAAGVIAIREKRYREIEAAFRLGDATAPHRAQPLEALGVLHLGEAEDLASRGILKPGLQPGTYYLDEAALLRRDDSRRNRVKLILILAIVAGVALAFLTTVGRQ